MQGCRAAGGGIRDLGVECAGIFSDSLCDEFDPLERSQRFPYDDCPVGGVKDPGVLLVL